jgi:MFS family permease
MCPGRAPGVSDLWPVCCDDWSMPTTLAVRGRREPLAALLGAEVVSTTGSLMTLLALPWFVLTTTGSPARMGLVLAAGVAPMVLLSIPGGMLAGRLGARRTMLASDLARAPLIGLIPLLHTVGVLSSPMLLGLVFVHGAFWPPYYASQAALLPELLGDDQQQLTRASALFQGATRLTLLAGPALGGVLIGWLGATNVLLLDAATYLVAFALVARRIPAVSPTSPRPGDVRGLLVGLRFLFADAFLRACTLAGTASQMAFQTLLAALPVLAFTRYGQDPRVAGLLVGAWGGGALLGSLAWLGQALPLWLLLVSLPAPAAVGVLFASGLSNGIRVPPFRAMVILRIPPSLRVQTISAETTLPFAAGLLALLVAGPAMQAFGVTPVLAATAAAATAGAAGFAVTAARMRRSIDAQAQQGASAAS